MSPDDRATGASPVDLDGWSEVLPDDADELVSSDLAAAAVGTGYAVLIMVVIIAAAVGLA